ncbi:MAG: hypothetical protein Q8R98_14620, partial [Rubrivivax sp.]|nr:hypothetical protein [Rubrivivax sp.]
MSARWDKSASLGPVKRPRTGPGDPGLDPYVRWAMATEWNGFKRKGGRMAEPVRLIACAPDVEVLNSLLKPAAAAPSGVRPESLEIPAAYGQKLGDMGYQPLHFTATISRSDLISWLVPNPLRLRWRLALPLRDAGRAAQASSKGLYGPARDAASMTAKNLVADDIRSLENLQHPQELHGTIGLIDAGCPFLNQAFESGAGTRIAAIWDQGAQVRRSPAKHRKTGWPWIRPQNFRHGRELGPNALCAIAQAAHSSRRLEETQVYRGLDYLIDYEDQRRRVWYGTHGGHLLDMAAGRTDPLAPRAPADAAANANLVFVDLPLSTAMDSSGGSLAAHVLDGVRYILSVAKPGHPTVVNISYGAQAGPHDGSSLIERALDELLEHGPA